MLRRAKDLNDYKLGARDGGIGKVKEFYFDARVGQFDISLLMRAAG